MKQVLQSQRSGSLLVDEVPSPAPREGAVLVRTRASLISAGTERTSVTTAQASLIGKARNRPDLVKQVLDNVRREGLLATYRKVEARLDSTKALGYSCAGEVLYSDCEEFRVGDRVACAGAGYASHAEVVVVPRNLCARLSPNVSFEAGAFTTLGAIALQGVRQADVRVGERVVVIGLGLLGLITVQILRAAGCRAIGVDLDTTKLTLASSLGAAAVSTPDRDSAVSATLRATEGRGADAVIITAGTDSNGPIELAGQLARDRARVVVVGAVRTDLPRQPFFEKELELRFSRSYGPGRYDKAYEEQGRDYPIGYVRWTEQRNMEAFVEMLAEGTVNVDVLTTHRFPVSDATKAYDTITGKTGERSIGVVLRYDDGTEATSELAMPETNGRVASQSAVVVGFVGAGNFATAHLLPALQAEGARLQAVVTSTGVSAKNAAQRFGFAHAGTDLDAVVADSATNLVFIATRHDTHASLVQRALAHDKAVFVEKPLAVTDEQLLNIRRCAAATPNARIMVGFNRRFSTPIKTMREFMVGKGPFSLLYRVNAGALPASHWLFEPEQGGRIIGEACHFVDVLQFLTDSMPVRVQAETLGGASDRLGLRDNVSFSITFEDGSLGTVLYYVGGAPAVGKEYLEVHGAGASAIMSDFRSLVLARGGSKRKMKFDGDKGHRAEVAATLRALREGSPMPIPFESLVSTTRVTFAVRESLATGLSITL